MSKAVYTYSNQVEVAALDVNLFSFMILNPRRQMRLNSLLWSVKLWETVSGAPIPLEQNNYLRMTMTVNVGGPMIGRAVFNITGVPGSTVYNGNGFNINQPGQYKFDSFFISQDLGFAFDMTSLDPLNSYTYDSSVIIEVEEGFLS